MAVRVVPYLDGNEIEKKSPSVPVGHTIEIQGRFYVDDVLTNPTACTITVREPDGTQTTPSVTSTGTGIRTATHSVDQAGWHRVLIVGTGTAAGAVTVHFYGFTTGLT